MTGLRSSLLSRLGQRVQPQQRLAASAQTSQSVNQFSQKPTSTEAELSGRKRLKSSGQSQGLSWQDLHAASQLARWSGHVYYPAEQLQQFYDKQGLRILGQGRGPYTSWVVAEGKLGQKAWLQDQLDRAGQQEQGKLRSRGLTSPTTHHSQPLAGRRASASLQLPPEAVETDERVQRFVLLRGVQWSAPETSAMDMMRILSNFWPVPFAAEATKTRSGSLVCHGGIAQVALDLFQDIAPLLHSPDPNSPLVFVGHSLGGSLATLLWALALLHGHRASDSLSCHTFGSPPVLGHEQGGADKILELLGTGPLSCRNWVQEHDPIPRAMMTADPYFSALLQNSTLRAILDARAWLGGEGSMVSSNRFLYNQVGEMYLITGGCEVSPIDPHDKDSRLLMSYPESMAHPRNALQFLLDHHHGSYAHDLEVAAKRELKGAMQKRQQGIVTA